MTKIFSSSMFIYAMLMLLSIGLVDMVRDTFLLEEVTIFNKSVLLSIEGIAGLLIIVILFSTYKLDKILKKENAND